MSIAKVGFVYNIELALPIPIIEIIVIIPARDCRVRVIETRAVCNRLICNVAFEFSISSKCKTKCPVVSLPGS